MEYFDWLGAEKKQKGIFGTVFVKCSRAKLIYNYSTQGLKKVRFYWGKTAGRLNTYFFSFF